MRKLKIIFWVISILEILSILLVGKVQANNSGEILLELNQTKIEKGEEFTLVIKAQEISMSAYLLEIYFDQTKVELISKPQNSNLTEGRLLYSWYDEQGGKQKSKKENLLELKWRGKQEGIAMFQVQGEFYNEQEEPLNPQIEPVEIKIGQQVEITQEEKEILIENQIENKNSTNLAILRADQEGMSPTFQKEIKEYYLTIGEEVNNLEITAYPENENSKVTVRGSQNLKIGMNVITIKVVAENESQETEYKIYVTKTKSKANANANLENLAVENSVLAPTFWEDVTNYKITVNNEVDKINILAVPQSQFAKVKVTGENKLKDGSNQVEIMVTAENGVTFKKYQIEVYRKSKLEMEKELEEKEEENQHQNSNENVEETEIIDNSKEIEKIEQDRQKQEANIRNMVVM